MPAVWCVYHVKKCSHARPAPKDKYVVIVCRESTLMGFLINTRIHPYILKRSDLLACQAVIEASSHRCLQHDSYVDCIDLYPFDDAELLDARESISEQAKAEIKKAVSNSKTIEKRYRNLILGT